MPPPPKKKKSRKRQFHWESPTSESFVELGKETFWGRNLQAFPTVWYGGQGLFANIDFLFCKILADQDILISRRDFKPGPDKNFKFFV